MILIFFLFLVSGLYSRLCCTRTDCSTVAAMPRPTVEAEARRGPRHLSETARRLAECGRRFRFIIVINLESFEKISFKYFDDFQSTLLPNLTPPSLHTVFSIHAGPTVPELPRPTAAVLRPGGAEHLSESARRPAGCGRMPRVTLVTVLESFKVSGFPMILLIFRSTLLPTLPPPSPLAPYRGDMWLIVVSACDRLGTRNTRVQSVSDRAECGRRSGVNKETSFSKN